MSDLHPVVKKLQFKDHGQPVLILHAPESYHEVINSLTGEVHTTLEGGTGQTYDLVQVFGTTNEELSRLAEQASQHVTDDGLLWLCYPKKTSKAYKGSDCSRDTVAPMLSDEGFEPVRQVAVDDDWSALRFRKTEHIKKLVRTFAHTEEGKRRTNQS